ncbi:MAG: hypothetical protein N3G75_09075 [Methanothrix sp.]|nr:hypothetical protein [Methanothrix sp.]MCX8207959.1 hypothetical protein [Methanothrix sp.]
MPRMADFSIWVVSCEPRMPWQPGEFLNSYRGNIHDSMVAIIEADRLAIAVSQLAHDCVKGGSAYIGSARQLYEELCRVAGVDPLRPPRDWPPTPKAMGYKLSRLAPVLRSWGVDVKKRRVESGSEYQLTLLHPMSENIVSWERVSQMSIKVKRDVEPVDVEEVDLR